MEITISHKHCHIEYSLANLIILELSSPSKVNYIISFAELQSFRCTAAYKYLQGECWVKYDSINECLIDLLIGY